jgi:hypothetical protein
MPTRKRKRSASPPKRGSPSRRMKKVNAALSKYLDYMSRNPENNASRKKGNNFIEYSGRGLYGQLNNGRNQIHKFIEEDEEAQRTMNNLRRRSRTFKNNPRSYIGESPVGARNIRYYTMAHPDYNN